MRSTACALLAALLLAGCVPGRVLTQSWDQFHGDAANSGQILIGTKPAKETAVTSVQVGPVAYSSPAFSPDGSVYVATFDKNGAPADNALVRVAGGTSPVVVHREPLGGQLSSPAVDAKGNVYVAQNTSYHDASHLFGFDSRDARIFDVELGREGSALAPPKVLNVGGGAVIFQPYRGGSPVGNHVIVVNEHGTRLADVVACQIVVGGSLIGPPSFTVPGLDLGPPYPPEAPVGIRAMQEDGRPQHYMVVATNSCGIQFYKFTLGATSSIAPVFTSIAFHDTDASLISAPAISADGQVVISDSKKRTTAYDLASGNEKWHYDTSAFVSTVPTLLPFAINFVYVASYDKLTKLDLGTGAVVGEVGAIGPIDASPAAAGENIFVSTQSGIFTYGLNLNLIAFTPLAGGSSSPAIGAAGEVVVATTDGQLFRFPGP